MIDSDPEGDDAASIDRRRADWAIVSRCLTALKAPA